MAELLLTWDFVEENIEIIFEKAKSDERVRQALEILYKHNPERFRDLMDAWKSKNFSEYLKKWYPNLFKEY